MSDLLAQRIAQPDLVGLPEWQVAEILNAPDQTLPTVKGSVSTKDAQELLIMTGEWSAIVIAAESGAILSQVRALAIALRDTIRQSGTIRMEVPQIYGAVAGSLSGLVAAQLISEGTRDALLVLAEKPQSWAEANGLKVTEDIIFTTRGRAKIVQEGA